MLIRISQNSNNCGLISWWQGALVPLMSPVCLTARVTWEPIPGEGLFDGGHLPVSHGALWFQNRSGWYESDLAGEVGGQQVRARWSWPGGLSLHVGGTGEASCQSLSTDHITEP